MQLARYPETMVIHSIEAECITEALLKFFFVKVFCS